MLDEKLAPRPLAAKVPEITALFWVIKILTTGTGEAASDWFASVNLVLARRPRRPRVRRGDVGAVPHAAVRAGDLLVRRPDGRRLRHDGRRRAAQVVIGIPYVVTTAFYAVALAVVFALWRRTEGTLSIHSIHTRRRELWYWLTVLLTFALGTAAGDLTAFVLHLGYFWSGVLFTAAIAVPAVGWRLRPEPGRRVLVGLRAHPPAGRVVRRLARQVPRARRPRLGRRRRQRGGDRRHRRCSWPTSRRPGTACSPRPSPRTTRLSAARPRPSADVLVGRVGQLLADQVHDRGVGERRDVAELAVLGHVAQQPAHDLAASGSWAARRRS